MCISSLQATWNMPKRKGTPMLLYLIENLVRVTSFYLRITPPMSGKLGVLGLLNDILSQKDSSHGACVKGYNENGTYFRC